jgi:poly-gamma-glutamate synthesis protein (capsule biosynthesis protein)
MPKSRPVSILVVGDIMLDRKVRNLMNEKGEDYPFEKVSGFFKDYDIVVGNLEGPITNNPSKTIDYRNKVLQFTFSTSTAEVLSRAGFTLLGLANNHSRDFGYEGYASTQEHLGYARLPFYGDYSNAENISHITEIRGKKIAFIGFHEFSYKNFEKVIDEIESIRATNPDALIIVTPHWGIEYEKQPSEFQIRWAHKFINAGADMVIGSHPHVVQTSETYNGGVIVYSLGNFVFDQDFSEGTKNGIGVEILLDGVIGSKNYSYRLLPLHIEKGQPEFGQI